MDRSTMFATIPNRDPEILLKNVEIPLYRTFPTVRRSILSLTKRRTSLLRRNGTSATTEPTATLKLVARELAHVPHPSHPIRTARRMMFSTATPTFTYMLKFTAPQILR